MDLDVDVAGQTELAARLHHASDGVLDLTRQLAADIQAAAPPQLAFASVRMHARSWGAGDVWTLPAGAWVAARDGRVHLPDDTDQLTTRVQELLDGS